MALARFLLLLLLITLTTQALNEEADADIRAAIKAAVLDGLQTTNRFVRDKYWYYIQGADRVSFNVSVLPQKLNYIILYQYINIFYRVNADLDKITWKPKINSFVKVIDANSPSTLLRPNISFVNSKAKVVDLTKQISVSSSEISGKKNQPPRAPTTQRGGGVQIISESGPRPSGQGIVVLGGSSSSGSQTNRASSGSLRREGGA